MAHRILTSHCRNCQRMQNCRRREKTDLLHEDEEDRKTFVSYSLEWDGFCATKKNGSMLD